MNMAEGGNRYRDRIAKDLAMEDLEDGMDDLRVVIQGKRAVVNNDGIWWVELHGQVYSFENLPNPDSTVVKICVNNFQENGLSDIGGLEEPFKEVCCNLEFAYNTAVANDMGKLENMINGVCFDMNKLCSTTGNTLVRFSRTSHDACIHYKGAFLYLLDGFEDVAHLKLEALVKSMSSLGASAELKRLIDTCNDNVMSILEWITEEKAKLGIAGEERMACEAGISAAKRDHVDAEERLVAENKNLACMEKRNMISEVIEMAAEVVVTAIPVVTLFSLPQFKVGATGAVTVIKATQRFIKRTIGSEDKIQLARKRAADLEGERLDARKRMIAQADRLEQARGREEVLNSLQPLLHDLSGSLRIVRKKLLCACAFWERLQTVMAPEMDKQQFQASVNALSATKEERAEFWRSKAFAEDAISMYARWVARKIVCDQSRVGVDEAYKMLDQLAVANPTKHDARAWLKLKAEGYKGQAIE
ncbi:uncharacterized protein LOC135494591 [Lineus longissimus]|uniref:uncharacterized protein LOC135494591 n=1 Tax=Lineus longissimus TaxID=88925 RepID=UPI00315CFA7F